MDEPLGIIGIKMVFDIHKYYNFLTKGGGVKGEQSFLIHSRAVSVECPAL